MASASLRGRWSDKMSRQYGDDWHSVKARKAMGYPSHGPRRRDQEMRRLPVLHLSPSMGNRPYEERAAGLLVRYLARRSDTRAGQVRIPSSRTLGDLSSGWCSATDKLP